MRPDGTYERRQPVDGEKARPAQETFIRLAEETTFGDGARASAAAG